MYIHTYIYIYIYVYMYTLYNGSRQVKPEWSIWRAIYAMVRVRELSCIYVYVYTYIH